MTSRAAPEVVTSGLRFAEGPVWIPAAAGATDALVVTEVAAGALTRVEVATGERTRVADVGGGANSALLASDGGFLVTQNGGIDFTRTGLYGDDPPPFRPTAPGIQRVRADGRVTYVTDASVDPSTGDAGALLAPNDLAVAADGTVWFTDPPHHPPPAEPVGRVHTMSPDGAARVVAAGFHYCNGIAFDPEGVPVVIEALGLVRLHVRDDGSVERDWVTERIGPGEAAGDGFCVDVDGRFYVAATTDHGIRILEPDGAPVDLLEIPGRGVTTNCCFGGADGRTLFATDGVPGQVVAWEGMPTPGLSLGAWPVPAGGG